MRPVPATALLALLLVGCSAGPDERTASPVVQGESRVEATPACTPAAAVARALPAGFPVRLALQPAAVLTSVRGGEVTGRAPGTPTRLLDHFRAGLVAAGQVVGRDEDERRSGQLTFLGGSTEGAVVVALLRCPTDATQFTFTARKTR